MGDGIAEALLGATWAPQLAGEAGAELATDVGGKYGTRCCAAAPEGAVLPICTAVAASPATNAAGTGDSKRGTGEAAAVAATVDCCCTDPRGEAACCGGSIVTGLPMRAVAAPPAAAPRIAAATAAALSTERYADGDAAPTAVERGMATGSVGCSPMGA